MHWYDGDNRPPPELLHGLKAPIVGCLLVGESGSVSSVDDMGANWTRLPENAPLQLGADYLPNAPTHFAEFAAAIRSNGTTMSNFADVACPFSETLLSGNLAVWTGSKIDRAEIDQAANGSGALALEVRPNYRSGYEF